MIGSRPPSVGVMDAPTLYGSDVQQAIALRGQLPSTLVVAPRRSAGQSYYNLENLPLTLHKQLMPSSVRSSQTARLKSYYAVIPT